MLPGQCGQVRYQMLFTRYGVRVPSVPSRAKSRVCVYCSSNKDMTTVAHVTHGHNLTMATYEQHRDCVAQNMQKVNHRRLEEKSPLAAPGDCEHTEIRQDSKVLQAKQRTMVHGMQTKHFDPNEPSPNSADVAYQQIRHNAAVSQLIHCASTSCGRTAYTGKCADADC